MNSNLMMCLTAALTLPCLAGTTYYVRTDGDDGADGKSWATAWASARKYTLLKDGDELVISNGVYSVNEGTVPNGVVTIRGFSTNAADTVLDAGGVSRVFFMPDASRPVVCNLTLRNGSPSNYSYGGLAIVNARDFVFSNVVFSAGVHAKHSGGAHVTHGGCFEDCVFMNCTASNGGGGAVQCSADPTDEIVFRRCRFTGNRALKDTKWGGGAIAVASGRVTISDCTFDGNSTPCTGGAIYIAAGDSATLIERTTFETNTVTSFSGTTKGGGAVADLCGTVTVDRCTFVRNDTIYGGGGAIYCGAAKGVPVIRNSTFSANNDVNRVAGGAISSAADMAGELYGPVLTNCSFVGHSVSGNGAALFGKFKRVEACAFTDNVATGVGGAWYVLAPDTAGDLLPTARFERCSFVGNAANKGGVFSTARAIAIVATNCTFAGNSAAQYGSVYSADSYAPRALLFRDCLFETNYMSVASIKPNNSYASTVITALGIPDVELAGCTFRGNRSLTRASVAWLGDFARVRDCVFERNVLLENALWTSDVKGGTLFLNGQTNDIRNCLFKENANRSGTGAGIFLGCSLKTIVDAAITIDNCDFIGNTSVTLGVGDAIGCSSSYPQNGETMRFANNLFLANTNSVTGKASTFSKEFNVYMPWLKCFSCCCDYDPKTAGTGDEKWFSHQNMPAENNSFQVADAAAAKLDAELMPEKKSPLVDKGMSLGWHEGATDLTGVRPRVFGKGPDIGCFEHWHELMGLMLMVR